MNVVNFDAKQCDRVRRQLDAYLSNELLVETTAEALKHLETCEACSTELEARMRVREALRQAVEKKFMPEHLEEVVRARLRKTQPAYFWQAPATWTVALASLALVLVAGQQWLRLRDGRQMVASVLALGVSDHVHCAIRGHNYPEIANPPEQLRRRLGPQYSTLLPVVEERLSGFEMLEAHICSVPGSPRRYVHFIARGRGTIVSVILTKREGENLPAGRFLVAKSFGGVDFYKAQLEATSVAAFEAQDYFGFVVSDLGQDEMVQLAASLAPAMRNALSAVESLRAARPRMAATALTSDSIRLSELFLDSSTGTQGQFQQAREKWTSVIQPTRVCTSRR